METENGTGPQVDQGQETVGAPKPHPPTGGPKQPGTGGSAKSPASDVQAKVGKPLSEMDDRERADYFHDQAERHKNALRNYARAGVRTVDQLNELIAKAGKHDALERELMTDHQKAVADAKDAAESEALGKYLPRLIHAEMRAAAAGSVDPSKLDDALQYLDLSKFASKDGEVDTDAVTKFVASISGSSGDGKAGKIGPSASGSGVRSSSAAPSIDAGRSAYEARHGKKTA